MITICRFIFICAALLALAGPAVGQEYLRWGGGPKTPDACLKWATDGSGRVLASGCSTASAVAANLINAGPTTGGSAVPTFRSLVAADIPALPASQISSGILSAARLGSGSGVGSSFLNGLGAFAALTLADLPSCPTTTAGSVLYRWNGSAIICGGVAGEDITSGTIPLARIPDTLTGKAAQTAASLAVVPTLCPSGQAPRGVDAQGNPVGCAAVSGGGGGAGATSQLTDFALAGTGTAVGAVSCATGRCNVATGDTVTSFSGLAGSCTLANGTSYAYVTSGGIVVFGASAAPTGCSGATPAAGITGYPAAVWPVARFTVSGGLITAITDDRAFARADKPINGTAGRIVKTAGSTSDTFDLAPTAVTPGGYTSANITVDAYGRITAASSGSGGGGTPGGSDGQVQFNSAGSFAGIAQTVHSAGTLRWNTSVVTGGLLRFGTTIGGVASFMGCSSLDSTTCLAIRRDGASTGLNLGINGQAKGVLAWQDYGGNTVSWTYNRIELQPHDGGAADVQIASVGVNAAHLKLSPSPSRALILDTTGTKPTCAVGIRGAFWYGAGGAGVKDDVQVCTKDAADAYAWRVLY